MSQLTDGREGCCAAVDSESCAQCFNLIACAGACSPGQDDADLGLQAEPGDEGGGQAGPSAKNTSAQAGTVQYRRLPGSAEHRPLAQIKIAKRPIFI